MFAATAAVTGASSVDEALASTRKTRNGSSRHNGSSAHQRKRGSKKVTTINVNGHNRRVTSTPDTMLLYVLRDELDLRGPKFGCGLAQCGACAVLADGEQIRSCVTPLSTVGTKKILTLDGLAASYRAQTRSKDKEALHPLQQAWIDEQVPQCGYCQSGMIIQAADLLSKKPRPTDAEIKQAMNGHLCRCGTYNGIVRAIKRAAPVMAKNSRETAK
ncbi:MAG TPA: (2Fe-2S)-binding protein [Solirubrobacteraceae bacterium]